MSGVKIKTPAEVAKAREAGKLVAELLAMIGEHVRPGATLGDVGHAIQAVTQQAGFSVVREYCGHGIGTVFHEDPQILHYGRPGTGLELQAGMIFTIEPMINAGRRDIRTMPDQWTVKTKDRSLSAQWEHTVLVTESGYDVLTVSAGTPARPPVVAATA